MVPTLGIAFIDRDHREIDAMFARVADTPDVALPRLLDEIARELAAHFAREEAALIEARIPVLLPHIELHAQLLREVDRMRRAVAANDPDVRGLIAECLPRLVAEHIATADAISAAFCCGDRDLNRAK
jgi:hemerythrin-like metal-binding protein